MYILPNKGHNGWGEKNQGFLKGGRKIRARNKRGKGKKRGKKERERRKKEEKERKRGKRGKKMGKGVKRRGTGWIKREKEEEKKEKKERRKENKCKKREITQFCLEFKKKLTRRSCASRQHPDPSNETKNEGRKISIRNKGWRKKINTWYYIPLGGTTGFNRKKLQQQFDCSTQHGH